MEEKKNRILKIKGQLILEEVIWYFLNQNWQFLNICLQQTTRFLLKFSWSFVFYETQYRIFRSTRISVNYFRSSRKYRREDWWWGGLGEVVGATSERRKKPVTCKSLRNLLNRSNDLKFGTGDLKGLQNLKIRFAWPYLIRLLTLETTVTCCGKNDQPLLNAVFPVDVM